MAFTVEDFHDLVRLLEEHPEWRAQLRPVILGEEILEIPSRMDRVEAALEQLSKNLQELITVVRDLSIRSDRTDGRMSNIEGELLEGRYERHLRSWFSKWLIRPSMVGTDDLQLFEAQASGRLSPDEQGEIEHLDLRVQGAGRDNPDEQLVLAVEVSHTINVDDVERAHARSKFLTKAGHNSRAFVGGYRISESAQRLADELEVIVDLRRPAA